jgi:putative SOS response-associated peptidase YedK
MVPAEAFYEWVGPKGRRQPLSIGRAGGKLLSLAGLFNYWKPKDSEGSPIATFTVITTAPNQWMTRIHNRMPAILQDDQIFFFSHSPSGQSLAALMSGDHAILI